MVPNLYTSGGIVFHTADMAAAIGFAGLVSENVDVGTQFRTLRKFASIYESMAAISAQAPTITYSTTQIRTFYDLHDQGGRCITSQADPARPGFDAYLIQHANCAARDLTDSRRFRFAEGYAFPGTLTATHGGVATITGTAIGSSSTANHPLAFADSIAAPTNLRDTESFGLWRQTVCGVELEGVKSMTIEHGVEVVAESADGTIWPEWISVGSVAARITLQGINPLWLSASQIPIDGKPMAHTNTILRLARHETDGQGAFMPLTEEEHITISVAGLGAITTAASASDDTSPATIDLQLIALHDGTNTPLVITTDINIEEE
jgi:hypothetical protein